MISHLLLIPPKLQEKVVATLASITREAHSNSLCKWRNVMRMLISITPDVSGLRGIFTWVQHALKTATGRHVQFTADVNNDPEAWRKLVRSLARRPTQLLKLQPFSPTWIRTTNASRSGMGGVLQDPEGHYFVW